MRWFPVEIHDRVGVISVLLPRIWVRLKNGVPSELVVVFALPLAATQKRVYPHRTHPQLLLRSPLAGPLYDPHSERCGESPVSQGLAHCPKGERRAAQHRFEQGRSRGEM